MLLELLWQPLDCSLSRHHGQEMVLQHLRLSTTQQFTKASVIKLGLDLGYLIRGASGIENPPNDPFLKLRDSAQQSNCNDCGIHAIDNAIALLQGAEPPNFIDPSERRLEFLVQILSALLNDQGVILVTRLSPEQYYQVTLKPLMDEIKRLV